MKKNNDKENRPEYKGKFYRNNDTNRYEGNISQGFKNEADLELEKAWRAELAWEKSEAIKRKKSEILTIKEKTVEEVEEDERDRFMDKLRIGKNDLARTNFKKVIIFHLIILLGIGSEYIVYQQTGENSMGFLGIKSYLFAACIVMLTKFVTYGLSRQVRHRISQQNEYKKNVMRYYTIAAICLIFFNGGALGLLNLDQTRKTNQDYKLEEISENIEDASSNEEIILLEAEYDTLAAKRNAEDTWFILLVKFLGIGLISILNIATCSVMYAVAELYDDTFREKKREVQLLKENQKHEAALPRLHESRDQVFSHEKSLIKQNGVKVFLMTLVTTFNLK